MFKKNESI